MKPGSSIVLLEILLLVILLLSAFTGFPISPEVLSKTVLAWLIGVCIVLIAIQRMLRS